MDKRITCDCCPLNGIGTDTLCESNCSDMADYKEEIYNQALEDVTKIYTEMQPQLATHVYEFGERIKALKKCSNISEVENE